MAIHVVGGWELSWNTPIKEFELWTLPMQDYDVSDLWMWPVSGIVPTGPTRLHERNDIHLALGELQDLPWAFIEPPSPHYSVDPEPLFDFSHPEDVVYIFGTAHFNPPAANLPREGDSIVMIPTVRDAGLLWPHQALVAVLYDRWAKRWAVSEDVQTHPRYSRQGEA